MKKRFLIFLAALAGILFFSSWGFYAHQKINNLAIFTLPQKLIRFYKNNVNYITEHAVDPDKRRYADTAEASRHYIDADHYGKNPFDTIPEKWKDAVSKLTEDTLTSYGTLPWQIEKTYYRLVKAFREKDSVKILKLSADLGHYVADAHVPLHTTENYNGQLTGQVGIHAFWESRIPELFSEDYDFWVGKARYIENPLKEAWKIIKHTYLYKDSVFAIEKRVSRSFPADKKYSFSPRNGKLEKQYTEEYSATFHEAMKGLVEQQMRSSILEIGSFWYSAWVDAGLPILSNLPQHIPDTLDRIENKKVDKLYEQGKILGRDDL